MMPVFSALFNLSLFVFLFQNHEAFQISKDYQLERIHQITTNEASVGCTENQYELVPVPVPSDLYKSPEEKAVLAGRLIGDTKGLKNFELLQSTLKHILTESSLVTEARIIVFDPFHGIYATQGTEDLQVRFGNISRIESIDQAPWLIDPARKFVSTTFMKFGVPDGDSYWTFPYFSCDKKIWKISFVSSITSDDELVGFLSFDVSLDHLDINQCPMTSEADSTKARPQLEAFQKTHKCHSQTSQCIFASGHGWTRGGYTCQCKPGYYSKIDKTSFNGSLVEVAYEAKMKNKDTAYNKLYVCGKCKEGCDTCTDDTPCLAPYNWTLRYIILTFSLICTLATFILIVLVYHNRRLKVFRLGSPTFLCITLLGCAIMYLEMVAIFPYLDVYFCIATKWTRHLGFLLTYSSLLLKTWRVNLTFRVKSAHKLKLTDKQLLQWLFPILLVMLVYLSAWTLSDPPQDIYIKNSDGLKFKMCVYGWWDHTIAIGEILFLIWGIKVCFSVRNARTHFNEAKWITWSIYNIAVVNIIMASIHLILLPNAGPDMKYFLGFLRTQLSTTVTILLVFGPKFYRLVKGTANELDDRIRARGNAASMIEVPLEKDISQKDIYLENEELKEEIQKLAGQIQYLKIVGMLMENRHIKPRKEGYFSKENCSKHFQHFLVRNGTVINCSKAKKEQKQQQKELENKNGSLMSPTSQGHAVILAEKSEENSYMLIEPLEGHKIKAKVDVNGEMEEKPPKTTSRHCATTKTFSETTKTFNETTKTFNETTNEPFIPERV